MKINMPIIKRKNYLLRDISINDYLDCFLYGSDFETTRYVTWGPYKEPEEALRSIDFFTKKKLSEGLPAGYAIVDTKTGHVIGQIDFHTYYPLTNCAEVGFILNKEYWNRGIITSALKDMIELGFNYQGLNKILVGHIDNNIASKRVIEKCDFRYESTSYGVFKDKLDGSLHNILYYSIFKEDFERGILRWQ